MNRAEATTCQEPAACVLECVRLSPGKRCLAFKLQKGIAQSRGCINLHLICGRREFGAETNDQTAHGRLRPTHVLKPWIEPLMNEGQTC